MLDGGGGGNDTLIRVVDARETTTPTEAQPL
jgi:hypothetical protein